MSRLTTSALAVAAGLAGVRESPGSPGGGRDGLDVLKDIVEHAVELVRGVKTGH